MANAFSDSKIARKFKTVSLSHQTVSRRVSEIGANDSDTLRCVMNGRDYCCPGLDDSTDTTDVCQLMIFVRTVDKNFESRVPEITAFNN
jgi:hypothetical protein